MSTCRDLGITFFFFKLWLTFVFLHGRTTLPHKYAPFPHPEIIKHNQLDCNEQFCAMFGKKSYYYFYQA